MLCTPSFLPRFFVSVPPRAWSLPRRRPIRRGGHGRGTAVRASANPNDSAYRSLERPSDFYIGTENVSVQPDTRTDGRRSSSGKGKGRTHRGGVPDGRERRCLRALCTSDASGWLTRSRTAPARRRTRPFRRRSRPSTSRIVIADPFTSEPSRASVPVSSIAATGSLPRDSSVWASWQTTNVPS